MKTNALVLVEGGASSSRGHHWHGCVEQSVDRAIRAGFSVGRRVRLGCVQGSVVGYNIGRFGRFSGASYPLLVRTEFGIAKCSLSEIAAV